MTEQELNASLDLTKKIDRLAGQLDDLRKTGGVGSAGTSEAIKGGCGAVSAGQIAAELEDEINELRRQREIEQVIIGRYIDKQELADIEHKVLRLRYVECRPWKMIETTVGYSRSHTYQIHVEALGKIGLNRT